MTTTVEPGRDYVVVPRSPVLERIVEFTPAFDKRALDPAKNYGIHGVNLRMVLKGPEGAVQFLLFTNWNLPHVQEEYDANPSLRFPHLLCHPMPADLGYHSAKPMYEGHEVIDSECPYVEGGTCYYDGSGLNAHRIYSVLLREGDAGVWRELQAYYDETFKAVALG